MLSVFIIFVIFVVAYILVTFIILVNFVGTSILVLSEPGRARKTSHTSDKTKTSPGKRCTNNSNSSRHIINVSGPSYASRAARRGHAASGTGVGSTREGGGTPCPPTSLSSRLWQGQGKELAVAAAAAAASLAVKSRRRGGGGGGGV